jgi:hypothetical protein
MIMKDNKDVLFLFWGKDWILKHYLDELQASKG